MILTSKRRLASKASTPTSLTPQAVAKVYNFPKAGPYFAKQKVGIVELGGGYLDWCIDAECVVADLPIPKMSAFAIDGAVEWPDVAGADGEVSLDVGILALVLGQAQEEAGLSDGPEIITGFSPNSNEGFVNLVAALTAQGCNAISCSWGMSESAWPNTARLAMDGAILAQVKQGAFFAAAGDNGSSDGATDGSLNVDYPASSPFSVGCGGTRLILTPDGQRESESVWGGIANDGATGGGKSVFYDMPRGAARGVPDISGNADPQSGYSVNVDGIVQVVGGTSAVAPLMAALYIIIQSWFREPIGDFRKHLYEAYAAEPTIFFDVVDGCNGAYSAAPGYDFCTGLGVPDGQKLLAYLQTKLGGK